MACQRTTRRAGRGGATRPISWFLNLGNGVFDPRVRERVLEQVFVDIEIADLDGDGREDVIVPLTFEDELWVLHGRADGGLAEPSVTPTYDYPLSVAAADLTRDGRLDVVLDMGPDMLTVHGGGSEGLGEPVGYAAQDVIWNVQVGDVNGDERLDVVALTPTRVELFLNSE